MPDRLCMVPGCQNDPGTMFEYTLGDLGFIYRGGVCDEHGRLVQDTSGAYSIGPFGGSQ